MTGYPQPAPAAAPYPPAGPPAGPNAYPQQASAPAAPQAPANPPAPAPQGYPGPAVPVGTPPAQAPPQAPQQPTYNAPVPGGYGAPPAPGGYPAQPPAPQGYGAPQGYQNPPPAVYGDDIGARIAGASIGNNRNPKPGEGSYLFEIQNCFIKVSENPEKLGQQTLIVELKILESSNPAFAAGSTVGYAEGLAYGMGSIKFFVIVAKGFASESQWNETCASQGIDPNGALANACKGALATPSDLIGRKIACLVSERDKTCGPRSRTPGKVVRVTDWNWSPVQM